MDFSARQNVEELMDQPGLDKGQHHLALEGLKRINWISGSDRIFWPALRRFSLEHPDKELKVLDIASGGGDVVLRLVKRAQQNQLPLRFSGSDFNPVAIEYAQQKANSQQLNVDFFQLDALQESIPEDYDVIMCSLFLHHLSDEQAVQFLKKIAAATRSMVLINDLRRSRMAYWLAYLGCRLLSRSSIVHVDGPLSVQSAYTTEEAREQAREAGMAPVEITHHWPQRFLLSWRKSA
ncbi:MAG: methyltransferase domain-containing protein [Planctomycetaceae bacterium]|nr:methyltransferase domain-containing protein [Planctomycetaceae bacterium]